jgi:transmembrane sensor
MSDSNTIHEIIIRSLTNTISQSERALLESWKGQSRANLLEYLDYETIWKESGRLSIPEAPDLNQALKQIRKKTGLHTPFKMAYWYNAAAVILLSVMFAGLYHIFTKPAADNPESFVVYQVVKATYGTQSQIQLADGTTVHLNSGSSIKYPVSFDSPSERTVELSGEAFFEVHKDIGRPFLVDIGKLKVNVTGTRFNVNAYEGNSDITVALIEGEVELSRPAASGYTALAKLKPGEVARLSLNENRLYINDEGELDKHYAWIEGKIVFMDDPIQIVAEKLSNWYNIDIEIADPKLDRYRFTGTFIEEPIEQILALLSRTSPMMYTITPSRKLDDNSFTRRKITLRSK